MSSASETDSFHLAANGLYSECRKSRDLPPLITTTAPSPLSTPPHVAIPLPHSPADDLPDSPLSLTNSRSSGESKEDDQPPETPVFPAPALGLPSHEPALSVLKERIEPEHQLQPDEAVVQSQPRRKRSTLFIWTKQPEISPAQDAPAKSSLLRSLTTLFRPGRVSTPTASLSAPRPPMTRRPTAPAAFSSSSSSLPLPTPASVNEPRLSKHSSQASLRRPREPSPPRTGLKRSKTRAALALVGLPVKAASSSPKPSPYISPAKSAAMHAWLSAATSSSDVDIPPSPPSQRPSFSTASLESLRGKRMSSGPPAFSRTLPSRRSHIGHGPLGLTPRQGIAVGEMRDEDAVFYM